MLQGLKTKKKKKSHKGHYWDNLQHMNTDSILANNIVLILNFMNFKLYYGYVKASCLGGTRRIMMSATFKLF